MFLLCSSTSNVGELNVILPLLLLTFPNILYFSPMLNLSFKYGWLNHVIVAEAVSSLTISLCIVFPLNRTFDTLLQAITSTKASSPSSHSYKNLGLLLSSYVLG